MYLRNIIYYTICTLHEKVYKGATNRKLGDRFREHVKMSFKTSRGTSSLCFAVFHDALMWGETVEYKVLSRMFWSVDKERKE